MRKAFTVAMQNGGKLLGDASPCRCQLQDSFVADLGGIFQDGNTRRAFRVARQTEDKLLGDASPCRCQLQDSFVADLGGGICSK